MTHQQQDQGYRTYGHGNKRIRQIQTIQTAITKASYATNFLAFQCTPKTLRRRTASKNAHRLPRRLRAWGAKDIAKSPPVKRKPKQCKRRPHPRNLVKEYQRRQGNKTWLETHIWHAKRMKMADLWGFRLARHLHFKSQRPSYRSYSHLSVIHDASYVGCLEWKGAPHNVAAFLSPYLDPALPCLNSVRFANGHRIGHQLLYQCYPTAFLCPVMFLWRNDTANDDDNAQLWMWIHASVFDTAHAMFKDAMSKQMLDIEMVDRRKDLVRFDFAGPQSTELLQAILEPVNDETINAKTWRALRALRSSSSLAPGVVLAMDVKDPRLAFPQKVDRHHAVCESPALRKVCMDWPLEAAAASRLWDDGVRNQVRADRPSDHALVRRRETQKSAVLDFCSSDVAVPIMLIQRGSMVASLTKKTNAQECAEGWTLLVPHGWAMPFWKSCTFAGARPAGLLEMRTIHFESGAPFYPFDDPATSAWNDLRDNYKQKAERLWQRRPPAKRVNYTLLDRKSPFEPAFETLVDLKTPLWVIRAKRSLLAHVDDATPSPWTIEQTASALVKVRIVLTQRGKPVQNAAILDPTSNAHIGYLTTAGFSMTEGKGAGIGACSLTAIEQLIKAKSVHGPNIVKSRYEVLVQNPNSPRRRAAWLTLIVI
ncbi:NUC188 domain-containing protein [Gongronella butleri]|nr:NUC188 domain-containing protein [Gongronella butleri]